MVKFASATIFADANMMNEQIDFLPLQPIRVRSNGKRDYDPAAKQRLVQMCLSSEASVSSMALKAGINANQLRKWIGQARQVQQSGDAALAPFVPVRASVRDTQTSKVTQTQRQSAVLSAKLPNGTALELCCSVIQPELIRALIEALWGQR
jgi:transposase